LKKDNAVSETKSKGNVEQAKTAPDATKAPVENIMDTVGLSRKMMEQIAKETGG
jgi:flagellar basal-body rod modification protein FlgD